MHNHIPFLTTWSVRDGRPGDTSVRRPVDRVRRPVLEHDDVRVVEILHVDGRMIELLYRHLRAFIFCERGREEERCTEEAAKFHAPALGGGG